MPNEEYLPGHADDRPAVQLDLVVVPSYSLSRMTRRVSERTVSRVRTRAHGGRAQVVPNARYLYWQEDDMWLGYLDEYPDYMTQGATLAELQENLRDIYRDVTSGQIPAVRRAAQLKVS